jgi:hypothetical protein
MLAGHFKEDFAPLVNLWRQMLGYGIEMSNMRLSEHFPPIHHSRFATAAPNLLMTTAFNNLRFIPSINRVQSVRSYNDNVMGSKNKQLHVCIPLRSVLEFVRKQCRSLLC